MPDTSQLTHPSMKLGAATRVFVEVASPGAGASLFELGAAEDVKFTVTRDKETLKERRHGIRYPVEQRTRELSGQITGRFLENVNPAVKKYLLGLGETQLKEPASVAAAEPEIIKFFGTEKHVVGHAAAIAASAPEPDIDELVSAVFGAGSAIPAGTHAYAVVAWYDAAETFGSYPNTDNQDWMDFAITAAQEYIALDWFAPAGVTPHHYTVYVQAGSPAFNPANPAVKLFETTGTSAVIGTHATDYPGTKTFGATPPVAFTLKSWDGATTYVLNTDYTFDTTKGEIAAVSGGALLNGVSYVLNYSYYRPASVKTPISIKKARGVYHRVVLSSMEEGNDGYEVGVVADFYKVDMQVGEASLSFPDDYTGGLDFTWDVLLDRAKSALGHVYDVNGLFATIDLNY